MLVMLDGIYLVVAEIRQDPKSLANCLSLVQNTLPSRSDNMKSSESIIHLPINDEHGMGSR